MKKERGGEQHGGRGERKAETCKRDLGERVRERERQREEEDRQKGGGEIERLKLK